MFSPYQPQAPDIKCYYILARMQLSGAEWEHKNVSKLYVAVANYV